MPAVKDVGEPCEGEPHARFDRGREETNASRLTPRAAPGASRLPDRYFLDEDGPCVKALHVLSPTEQSDSAGGRHAAMASRLLGLAPE
jgi:hypothetical protein